MNAEAIVDSQNCRMTLYVVGWIIIQAVCLCCLKPGVPVLDIHAFGRRKNKRVGRKKVALYIYSKREKSSSL